MLICYVLNYLEEIFVIVNELATSPNMTHNRPMCNVPLLSFSYRPSHSLFLRTNGSTLSHGIKENFPSINSLTRNVKGILASPS